MPRLTPERRAAQRQRIVDAARTAMLRDGLQATSMARVIEESGLSAGAIYGYFASKDELAAAARSIPTEVAGLHLDERTRRVTVDGTPVHLTPTEFDVLAHLVREPGTVARREEIVAAVWGWDDSLGSRTLDSHVKALRAKVGAHRVRTVHGVGYALELPGPDSEAPEAAEADRAADRA